MASEDVQTSLTLLNRLSGSPTPEDWLRFFEIYANLIATWCQHSGVAKHDIDDIVQDVMLVVSQKIQHFEHRWPSALRHWLRTILRLRLKQHFRQSQHLGCSIALDDLEDPASGLSAVFNRDHDLFVAAQVMRNVRKDFSETTWDAFYQTVVLDQPTRLVADTLQISLNAVIKAKARVLTRIRESLGSFGV